MTGAAIARKFGVATKTVTNDWFKDGCPRNKNKSFDLDKVLAWRKAKLQAAANDPAVKMQASKTALQAKRLMLQCEKLETELSVIRGKLHEREPCARSLLEIRVAESREWTSLPGQFKAAFPEVSAQQMTWMESWVKERIGRLHNGDVYSG